MCGDIRLVGVTMRRFLILSVVFLSMINFALIVDAENVEGDTLSQQQKQIYWERLDFVEIESVLSFDDIHNPIVCLDVSDSHELLIALDGCEIVVTDNEYNILNVYGFDYEGAYYVFWKNGNIGLILGRSDLIVEISPDGEFIEMTETNLSDNDVVKFWNGFNTKHKLTVGEKDYVLKNDIDIIKFLMGSYSQLILVDEAEQEIVLFDSGFKNQFAIIAGNGLFLTFIIFTIVKAKHNSKRGNDGNTENG